MTVLSWKNKADHDEPLSSGSRDKESIQRAGSDICMILHFSNGQSSLCPSEGQAHAHISHTVFSPLLSLDVLVVSASLLLQKFFLFSAVLSQMGRFEKVTLGPSCVFSNGGTPWDSKQPRHYPCSAPIQQDGDRGVLVVWPLWPRA